MPLIVHATKQILDQWGEDGWELVQVLTGPDGNGLVAYLKRRRHERGRGPAGRAGPDRARRRHAGGGLRPGGAGRPPHLHLRPAAHGRRRAGQPPARSATATGSCPPEDAKQLAADLRPQRHRGREVASWATSTRSPGWSRSSASSASDPSFTGQPGVINGASELLGKAFGDAGVHARSAVGVAVLPLDAPVEVEIVVAPPRTDPIAVRHARDPRLPGRRARRAGPAAWLGRRRPPTRWRPEARPPR